MSQCGADTTPIDRFIDEMRHGTTVRVALAAADIADCVRRFVLQSFDVIDGENVCALASAFTFGREDLLPDLFQRIVDRLNLETGGGLEVFRYYLQRHIGLDGDEHGP